MPVIRAPLSVPIESRAASLAKDSKIVNGYVDMAEGMEYVIKRPGTTTFTVSPAIPSGIAYGLESFNGKLYTGVGGKLYEVTSGGVSTDKGAIAVGKLSFSETSQAPYLFMQNGTQAWTLHGGTGVLAEVTDADFPPKQIPALSLCKGAVYLDDIVFVMTTGGRIYNSGIEDPTSWGALDYISKIAEPDGGVAITKHLNFLVAWGSYSGEFFFNAGNATGSPLDRSPSYKMDIGCASGDSMVRFSQTTAWMGQSKELGRGIYILDGVSPVKISTAAIERYLNASTLASVDAHAKTISGHTMYVLNLIDLDVTLVYDMQSQRWYTWSTDNAGADIVWKYGFNATLGNTTYLQNRTTGGLATLSTSVYQDETTNINYRIVTFLIDAQKNNIKFWTQLEIIGDKIAATMQIRHTDDDYQTFSSYRNVDLSLTRPILRQLGSARRRAYDLFSTSNVAIRLQAMEILIKEGTF